MRFALLGAIIGGFLGVATGDVGGLLVLAFVGLVIGLAFGRQRKADREDAEDAVRAGELASGIRRGVRQHLIAAEARGLIDHETLERLITDLDGGEPSAGPVRAAGPRRGPMTHRTRTAVAARLRPDPACRPLFMMEQGTPLRLEEERGLWALVSRTDGKAYWVAANLLVAVEALAEDRPVEARPEVVPAPAARAAPRPVEPPAEPPRPRPPRPVAARPKPQPVPPGRLAVSFEQFGRAAVRAWKSFTADIAIHTLIYVGVLLLVVVMFVFFAFGFYGDMVSGDRWRVWRPVVALGIPVVLFTIAWMLRTRTGIPFTANAIGLIAALSLPIMLSTLFQDGAWGMPDIEGSARWIAYSAVGVVIAVVYLVASKRSLMYGYLVGPGLWTAVGSLALYLEDGLDLLGKEGGMSFGDFTSDGVSGLQMTAVVGAIAATVPILSLFRRSEFGKAVAVRVVRAAVVCLPVIAGLAVAFAFSDARASGIARPEFADIGPVTVATLALAGAAMLWIRRAEYAAEGFGPRVRRWISEALAGLGHLALLAAWLLSIGVGLDTAWAGVGLVAYSAVIGLAGQTLGLRAASSLWVARIAGAAGLGMALIDPVPTIVAWGAAAVVATTSEIMPRLGERARGLIGVEGDPLSRLAVVVIPVAVAVSGVARLVPAAAASWVVVAGAAVLTGYRLLPGRVLPLAAGFPAGVALLTGIGLEIARTVDRSMGSGEVTMVPLGILLLASAAVGGFLRVPIQVRFPFVTVAATVGATLVLRELVSNPVVADAGVAAVVGTGLCIAAVIAWRSVWASASDVLGHLAVYASLAVALAGGTRTGVVLALGAVVAVHGAGAWAADRGRSPLAALGAAPAVNTVIQGIVASIAVPVLAVVAADAFTAIHMERPRAGLILAVVAWLYVAGLRFISVPGLRTVMVIGAYAVAAAGIAVTAPSQTAAVMSVSSAALATGAVAYLTGSPARSAPAWMLGVATCLLAASRFGVDQGDLHFWLFGIGLLMALGPVVIGRRDRIASRWLHPPLALGLLLIPVGVGFAIADRHLLALLALLAAGAYVVMGLLLRFGGFSLPAAVMVGIAYAHLVEGWQNPFEEPLVWMPLAAGFAVAGMFSSGRRFERGDAGFGLVTAWLATTGLAVVVGLAEDDLGWIVLITAGLLSGYGAVRRSLPFWYSGLVSCLVAGGLFGPGWAALALVGDAAAVGVHAMLRNDRVAEMGLVPLSVGLAGSAFGMMGVWQDWTPGEVIALVAIAAVAVAVITTASSIFEVPRRLEMWVAPAHGLAQLGLAVVLVMALLRVTDAQVDWQWAGLSVGEARLVVAGVLGFEAVLVGVLGTVRRELAAPWVSLALAAGAYGMVGVWAELTAGEVAGFVMASAMVVAVVASVLLLIEVPERLGLWVWPLHGLAQLGLVVVLILALTRMGSTWQGWAGLSVGEARLVVAGVLGFEAVLVGVLGTVRRELAAPWVSLALAAGAYGMVGAWAQWTPGEVVGFTLLPGLAVAAGALALSRTAVTERVGLWVVPLHALAQVAMVTGGLVAMEAFSAQSAAWVWAGLLAAEAAVVAVAAPLLRQDWRPRDVAAVLAAGSILCAAGAIGRGPEQTAALQLAAGLGAMALLVARPVEEHAPEWWSAVWVFGLGAIGGGIVLAAALVGPVAGGTAGALAIGGAGLVVGGLRSGRWPAAYVGMLMVLGAGLMAGKDLLGGNRHAYAVSIAVVLLIILDLERIRLTRLDHPKRLQWLDQIRVMELVVMGAPLVMAVVDGLRDVVYTALLAGESVAILLWAIASQVKRRLLVGVLGLVAAILIPAVVLAIEAGSGGISMEAVLGIAAAVAVVFIIVGSLLERGRAKVGQAVQRLSEILEDWE